MNMKAYRGPNGWYMAEEDGTGTHRQPADGGRYHTRAAAEASERQPLGRWVDYDGTIYDEDGDIVGRA